MCSFHHKTMTKKTTITVIVLIAIVIVIAFLVHKPSPTAVAPTGTDQSTNVNSNNPSNPTNGNPANTSTSTATSTPAQIIRLDSVSPNSGRVGTQVTIKGSGFTANTTVLMNSNVAAKNETLEYSANGMEALTFLVPSSLTADCKAGQACPQYAQLVTPGSYQISIENENGKSNTLQFDVVK